MAAKPDLIRRVRLAKDEFVVPDLVVDCRISYVLYLVAFSHLTGTCRLPYNTVD